MSQPDKPVYKLPDLMPAPTSDIGGLARRLIEFADLSAVRSLLDELERYGRAIEVYEVKKALGLYLTHHVAPTTIQASGSGGFWGRGWIEMAEKLLPTFWFDIFDLTESLAALERRLKPNTGYTQFAGRLMRRVLAATQVAAGQAVYATPDGHVRPLAEGGDPALHVGTAVSDSYLNEDGETMVDVQFSAPPPAGASGENEQAVHFPVGAAVEAMAAMGASLSAADLDRFAGTPSPGSPDPSNPPEQVNYQPGLEPPADLLPGQPDRP